MSRPESEWVSIDTEIPIYTARYRFPGGVSRTTMVGLQDGDWVVYSPGRGLEESAARLVDGARDIFLLAPSAPHLLGLSAWKARFPRARVTAPREVSAPVRYKTSIERVEDTLELQRRLPSNVSLHPLPACRTAEVWLRVEGANVVTWLTCDAITNVPRLPDGFIVGLLMKLYRLGPGLEVTRVFRYRAITEPEAFREWALAAFAHGRRNVLIPCHGDVLDGEDATERLNDLIQRRF